MSFKSNLYDREGLDQSRIEWKFLLAMMLLVVVGVLLEDVNETLGTLSLVIAAIGIFWTTYKDHGKKEPPGKYVGELILDIDQFTIDKEKVSTSEIQDMKIVMGDPKGTKIRHRYTYTIASGTKNELELTIKGVKRKYNFLWIDDLQTRDLRPVLEGLYKKRIFVREYFHGERTYLFEELTYEEIQEFKKKYNVW